MPRPPVLDKRIIDKVNAKLGRGSAHRVNSRVSWLAGKLGISAEAALVVLAKQHGVRTTVYQRTLSPEKQAEIRESLPSLFAVTNNRRSEADKSVVPQNNKKRQTNQRAQWRLAVEYMIQDNVLLDRTISNLMARRHFDIPINQATLILEERIRQKAKPPKRMVGEELVGFAFNPEIPQTVLKISDDPDDQRGFTFILRGMVSAFRNKTHHHLIDSFTREEALRVCGFVDVLLGVVDKSTKVK